MPVVLGAARLAQPGRLNGLKPFENGSCGTNGVTGGVGTGVKVGENGTQLARGAPSTGACGGTADGTKEVSSGADSCGANVVSSAQSGRSILCVSTCAVGSDPVSAGRRKQAYRNGRLEAAPEPRSARVLAVEAMEGGLSRTVVPVLDDMEVLLDDLESADLAE